MKILLIFLFILVNQTVSMASISPRDVVSDIRVLTDELLAAGQDPEGRLFSDFYSDVKILSNFMPSQGQAKGQFLKSWELRKKLEKQWDILKLRANSEEKQLIDGFFKLRQNGHYGKARIQAQKIDSLPRRSYEIPQPLLDEYRQKVKEKLRQLPLQLNVGETKLTSKGQESVFSLRAKTKPEDGASQNDTYTKNNSMTPFVLSAAALMLVGIAVAIMKRPRNVSTRSTNTLDLHVEKEKISTGKSFSQSMYDDLNSEGLFFKPLSIVGLPIQNREDIQLELIQLGEKLKTNLSDVETKKVLKQAYISFQSKIKQLKKSQNNPTENQRLIEAYRVILKIIKQVVGRQASNISAKIAAA